jgi:hypothetical protein
LITWSARSSPLLRPAGAFSVPRAAAASPRVVRVRLWEGNKLNSQPGGRACEQGRGRTGIMRFEAPWGTIIKRIHIGGLVTRVWRFHVSEIRLSLSAHFAHLAICYNFLDFFRNHTLQKHMLTYIHALTRTNTHRKLLPLKDWYRRSWKFTKSSLSPRYQQASGTFSWWLRACLIPPTWLASLLSRKNRVGISSKLRATQTVY